MKMRSAETIGEVIRSHRERSGLSQRALAELAEVGKTSISHIEKGKPTVRLATLLAVLHTLNIELVLDGPLMTESSAKHRPRAPRADGGEQSVSRARVSVMDTAAGLLEKHEAGRFVFRYLETYSGPPVSLSMPVARREYSFDCFPPFFEGLLPEGMMLEGLLHQQKLDRDDLFGQLLAVGEEMVGAVTVVEEAACAEV